MKKLQLLGALGICFAAQVCVAQEITIEEMQMLDQWRAAYSAKGVQLKPEDEVRLLQRMRAMKSLATPGALQSIASQPQQAQTAPPEKTSSIVTEAELAKAFGAMPPMPRLVSFSYVRDGLKYNDQRFADAEGVAERIALDPETATAAYVVPSGTSAAVKIVRLGSGTDPITIGKLTKTAGRSTFVSVTGKTISGDLFFPLTDGALLMRDSVGFRYVIGEGIKQINFPTGWAPTPLQRGNPSTTGWILLERDTAAEKKSLFSSIKDIGAMVGLVPANMDYALFNLNDSKLIAFEIDTSGKSVASYSQCKKASNGLVNVCDQMTTYDSIWKKDGNPNWTHYFWAIDWQKSQGKPFAVALEKSLRQLNAIDLSNLKKVNLFERTMGINSWRMDLAEDGKYQVKAQLAFDTQSIPDIAKEIQIRPELLKQ